MLDSIYVPRFYLDVNHLHYVRGDRGAVSTTTVIPVTDRHGNKYEILIGSDSSGSETGDLKRSSLIVQHIVGASRVDITGDIFYPECSEYAMVITADADTVYQAIAYLKAK